MAKSRNSGAPKTGQWQDIQNATTAPKGYKWQSNGKSRFSPDYETRLVAIDGMPASGGGGTRSRVQALRAAFPNADAIEVLNKKGAPVFSGTESGLRSTLTSDAAYAKTRDGDVVVSRPRADGITASDVRNIQNMFPKSYVVAYRGGYAVFTKVPGKADRALSSFGPDMRKAIRLFQMTDGREPTAKELLGWFGAQGSRYGSVKYHYDVAIH